MNTTLQLRSSIIETELEIEHKKITFSVNENDKGRFLIIKEYNTLNKIKNLIIIPVAGLDDFCKMITKILEMSKNIKPINDNIYKLSKTLLFRNAGLGI